MNREEAQQAVRRGVVAAAVMAVMSVFVVLTAMYSESDRLKYFDSPWLFVDVLIVIVLAVGLYRRSRTAAVLLLVFYIASKIILAIETDAFGGLFIAALFVFFFTRAAQATFALHRIRREEDPSYQPGWKLPLALGLPVASLIVLSLTMVLLGSSGLILPSKVIAGSEVDEAHAKELRTHLLDDDERIEYLYPHDLTSLMESGNVLTDRRVILYVTDENEELMIYEMPLSDVRSVELETTDGLTSISEYRVIGEGDDNWLMLYLSTESRGDQDFVAALRKHIPLRSQGSVSI